jgi:hypothetical protein
VAVFVEILVETNAAAQGGADKSPSTELIPQEMTQ